MVLHRVDVGERSLDAYQHVVPTAIIEELRAVAAELKGLRVLHLNSTPYGGGVSELLRSEVPLFNDLGLAAEWRIIRGDEPFFKATKAIHNGLQGAAEGLTAADREAYAANAERNAGLLEREYDVMFVHDPQPAGILRMHGHGGARWIWRCHIDTAQPNLEVWEFLRPYLVGYDATIFTMAEFLPADLPIERHVVIPPAIDPLSPKNMTLHGNTARQVLDWIGIDLDLPLVTQVSRFDPWKDPMGVIAAYRLVREEFPALQLALVGSMALDDPQGWDVYREIQQATGEDPRIHIFTNLTGVGNVEVNAFQRLSQVVVQKSIREGFGLVVSEALWKGTPVVAGRAGGIPLQMADGRGGYLVQGVEECAEAIARLLRDPQAAADLGASGQRRVRDQFLLPRLMLDELHLVRELVGGATVEDETSAGRRDPYCGMTIHVRAAPRAIVDGRTYAFCSQDCRAKFLAASTAQAS
jgi:trehalose synthase